MWGEAKGISASPPPLVNILHLYEDIFYLLQLSIQSLIYEAKTLRSAHQHKAAALNTPEKALAFADNDFTLTFKHSYKSWLLYLSRCECE